MLLGTCHISAKDAPRTEPNCEPQWHCTISFHIGVYHVAGVFVFASTTAAANIQCVNMTWIGNGNGRARARDILQNLPSTATCVFIPKILLLVQEICTSMSVLLYCLPRTYFKLGHATTWHGNELTSWTILWQYSLIVILKLAANELTLCWWCDNTVKEAEMKYISNEEETRKNIPHFAVTIERKSGP